MVSDAVSHRPTEEAIEAGSLAIYELVKGRPMPAGEINGVEAKSVGTFLVSKAAVDAAYPLIRSRVCQELAEALRERAHEDGLTDPAWPGQAAAEWCANWIEAGRG